ncbi:MAG TPA: hypothetical protein PKN33_15705 [Phycisphaerae bacterium]|nr:hypothetical protein [Phycisphaerales bacterium]HNO79495.1 hypothetical protein [Phycisphaerae bacterium]
METTTNKNASIVDAIEPLRTKICSARPHTNVYHVRCGACNAVNAHAVATDSVRMICPSCYRRMTLPATIQAECEACGAENDYGHTLAGHSAACATCQAPVAIGPIVGKVHSRRRSYRRHHRHSRLDRTYAFSEGAERSMILLAAAIATLIFVVLASEM